MIFKIVLDTTSSIIYGAIYGPSVMLSGPFVFLYQATILIFAGFLQPLLSDAVINEISAIGSLLIFAMSLDLLGILKLKVANYLPALLGPILYYIFILIKNSWVYCTLIWVERNRKFTANLEFLPSFATDSYRHAYNNDIDFEKIQYLLEMLLLDE